MSARVVLHLRDDQRAALNAGKMGSLYAHIKRAVERRGGQVDLTHQFPQLEADGHLHIVDNARKPHPDTLIAALAYLEGCWHLDPKGVLADSSIAERVYDPATVDRAAAESYVAELRARFSEARNSRYHQKRQVEEIAPDSIVIFLQGPPPYRRGHAYMSREAMIRSVVEGAGGRGVYVKPHPLRKDEGLAVIKGLQAEGLSLIKTNANVHDLLAQAAVTVSANSAVSLEGFLHGTPTILFARSDFAAMAEEVREIEAFPEALERAVTQRRDYTPFLYWYFRQCLWLDAPDFEADLFARFESVGFDAQRLGLNCA